MGKKRPQPGVLVTEIRVG